jgi:hypothetical protein
MIDAQTLAPLFDDLLPDPAVVLSDGRDEESILDEAKRITATVRHGDYGWRWAGNFEPDGQRIGSHLVAKITLRGALSNAPTP